MMLEFKTKQKIYIAIFLYSLVFFLIRFMASKYGMTYDEAEQFMDAKDYVLGYSDQPPLYSWILKTFSYVFGLNVQMMMLVYHLVTAMFLIFLFKICELVFNSEKKVLYCFLSYTLFFIYSYDFYRYTIHTALMMLMCSLSLYFFLKIYFEKQTLTNYLALGTFFGFGLLSKYNFIFFILALIISCLFTSKTRKILFDVKTIFAVSACLVISAPHFMWVMNNDFAPIHYALKRGEAGGLEEDFSLISVLLNTYWNFLVYGATMGILFMKDLKPNKNEFAKFALVVLGFCILFPLALIVFLKAGNFSQRWLAPLNIFLPIVFFSFIEIDIDRATHKLFKVAIAVMILVFYIMRVSSYYFPNPKRPSFLCKPYKAIYSNFKKDLFENGIDLKDKDLDIYSFKEVGIMAGIKSFNSDLDVTVIYPETGDLNFSKDLLIFSKDNREAFNQFIDDNKLKYELIISKVAPYLHLEKAKPYKVFYVIIDSSNYVE